MHIPRPTRERQPATMAPQSNGARTSRREAAPAPIGRRAQGESFETSFDHLQRQVEGGLRQRHRAWEARIVAGVWAALEFAAANPGEIRALTIEARSPGSAVDRQDEVITYFTKLFNEAVPVREAVPDRRRPGDGRLDRDDRPQPSRGGSVQAAPGPRTGPRAYLVLMPYAGRGRLR